MHNMIARRLLSWKNMPLVGVTTTTTSLLTHTPKSKKVYWSHCSTSSATLEMKYSKERIDGSHFRGTKIKCQPRVRVVICCPASSNHTFSLCGKTWHFYCDSTDISTLYIYCNILFDRYYARRFSFCGCQPDICCFLKRSSSSFVLICLRRRLWKEVKRWPIFCLVAASSMWWWSSPSSILVSGVRPTELSPGGFQETRREGAKQLKHDWFFHRSSRQCSQVLTPPLFFTPGLPPAPHTAMFARAGIYILHCSLLLLRKLCITLVNKC